MVKKKAETETAAEVAPEAAEAKRTFTKECPKCGPVQVSGGRVGTCPDCGTVFPITKECLKCGTVQVDNRKVVLCPKCGTQFPLKGTATIRRRTVTPKPNGTAEIVASVKAVKMLMKSVGGIEKLGELLDVIEHCGGVDNINEVLELLKELEA